MTEIPSQQDTVSTHQRKAFCANRILDIIEHLSDGVASVDFFNAALVFLDQTNFDDLVEERSAGLTCGYIFCGNKISQALSKKQFTISRTEGRVYDISIRRQFCSDWCYRASQHIRQQIAEMPAWLRTEREFYEPLPVNLLARDAPGLAGDVVAEVGFSYRPAASHFVQMQRPQKSSQPDSDKDREDRLIKAVEREMRHLQLASVETEEEETQKDDHDAEDELQHGPLLVDLRSDLALTSSSSDVDSDDEPVSKQRGVPTAAPMPVQALPTRQTKNLRKEKSPEELLVSLLAHLRAWFTGATAAWLRREEESVAARPATQDPQSQEFFDKVKSFYGTPAEHTKEPTFGTESVLTTPPVDSVAQKSIRRKLVLDRLAACMKPLLAPCEVSFTEIQTSLRELLLTFEFTAKNISLPTCEWRPLSVLILALMAKRDEVTWGADLLRTQAFGKLVREHFRNVDAFYEYLTAMMREMSS